ncbi:MAG: hypothetical protein GY859_04380 [Desulfobacterales bacterium]|nr:hypothetical protein [Desulfobacterales bacterium]
MEPPARRPPRRIRAFLNGGGSLKSAVNPRFEISDSGRGITEEDQHRIFDAFEQVAGRRTSPAEGTGLGLAITHKIVHLMRGDISLISEPGEGTAFTIELPDVEIAADAVGKTGRNQEFDPVLRRI